MGALGGFGGLVALAVAVTLTVAVVTRLRQPAHRRSLGELVAWRLVTAVLALGAIGATLWDAAAHTLDCVRGANGVDCVIQTKRLSGTERREVPGVYGAEVEERVVLDRNGDPEQQSRLSLLTTRGRVAVAGFDEVDASGLERELQRYLADGTVAALHAGSDARVLRLAMAWTWLMVALSALFVRW